MEPRRQPRRHALCEPMVWLVWGLPAVVVVASMITIWLAATSGNADPVRDEVQRMAQVQTTELARDEHAARLGLSAVLSLRDGQAQLLPVSGVFAYGDPLELVLAHPTRSAQDRALALLPQDRTWRAEARLDDGHDWNVEVASPEGGWRIVGRLKAGEHAVRLGPALPAQ